MRFLRKTARLIVALVSFASLYLLCFIYGNGTAPRPLDLFYPDIQPSQASLSSSRLLSKRLVVKEFRTEKSFPAETLEDFSTSVPDNQVLDLTNFYFMKNASHVCHDSRDSPYIVAFVHSAPINFIKRNVIRETWASPKTLIRLKTKVVFIIGSSNDSSVEERLNREYIKYGDLVQGNFRDSYRNLTYKHLIGFKWLMKFCNNSRFVMKADDDAFVDIFKVTSSLKEMFDLQSDKRPAGILACSLFPDGTAAKRQGKWALSLQEYPNQTYPAYCSGIAYFASPDVIFKLFEGAHRISSKFIWIDDLFVTGIIASFVSQTHQPLNFKFNYDHERLRQWLMQKDLKGNPYLVGDIGDTPDWKSLMFKLWEKTLRVS